MSQDFRFKRCDGESHQLSWGMTILDCLVFVMGSRLVSARLGSGRDDHRQAEGRWGSAATVEPGAAARAAAEGCWRTTTGAAAT